jgi:hypothetical protein
VRHLYRNVSLVSKAMNLTQQSSHNSIQLSATEVSKRIFLSSALAHTSQQGGTRASGSHETLGKCNQHPCPQQRDAVDGVVAPMSIKNPPHPTGALVSLGVRRTGLVVLADIACSLTGHIEFRLRHAMPVTVCFASNGGGSILPG